MRFHRHDSLKSHDASDDSFEKAAAHPAISVFTLIVVASDRHVGFRNQFSFNSKRILNIIFLTSQFASISQPRYKY